MTRPTTLPDRTTVLHLHRPETVLVDGADPRHPEHVAALTICRTCSIWEGDDLTVPRYHPCPTWTALQTRTTTPAPDPWMETT